MIQIGTVLVVSDNSGARKAKCIKVLKKNKTKLGQVGCLIVVSLQEIASGNQRNLKKGQVYRAVVLETKRAQRRQDGSVYTFQRNTVALLSPQGSPLGTRIQGAAPFEVREKKFMRLLALTSTTF